jgi:hypothetical protein
MVLCRAFHGAGHQVVVLSRRPGRTPWRVATWDAAALGAWTKELSGADALVNLVGRSVNCRYTPENRRPILDSRIHSARVLGEALASLPRPPRVWLQSSTATIYTHRHGAPNDEARGIVGIGSDAPETWKFSTGVCTSCKRTAQQARLPGVRRVLLRTAFTMSPDPGGVFDVMLWLVRRGLRGTLGSGRQYICLVDSRSGLLRQRALADRSSSPPACSNPATASTSPTGSPQQPICAAAGAARDR